MVRLGKMSLVNESEVLTTERGEDANWEDLYPSAVTAIFALDIVNSLISTLGCIGNVFTMLIIAKWDNISSGAAFMFALALTDVLAVFYDGIIDCLLMLFGFILREVNSSLCAMCTFFSWITTVASYYITACFSMDKCIAVLFPFKYRNLGTPRLATVVTIVMYVFCGSYSSTGLFVYRLGSENGYCRPVDFRNLSFSSIKRLHGLFLFHIPPPFVGL